MRFRMIIAAAAALACLMAPAPAAAWGSRAHRVVGLLAQDQLQPDAAAEVARLLAGQPEPTLAGVAYWADAEREAGTDLGERTERWHYVNLPATCEYAPARDCPDGDCVIAAVNAQAAVLRDRARPDAERAQALKFLVHLVADAHQPLHAGLRKDKGGNTVQVHIAHDDTVRNLHAVWDRLLPAREGLSAQRHADVLRALPPLPPDPVRASDRPVTEWTLESCRIVHSPGFYPVRAKLEPAYLYSQRPVAEHRLREAARRLAELLNRTLARPPSGNPKR